MRVLPARIDGRGRTRDEGTQAHPEQVIPKLCEANRLLGKAREAEVCRHLRSASRPTAAGAIGKAGWKAADDVSALELARENQRLKAIVAD